MHRRIGVAALLSLMAMAVGLVMAPAVGQAAGPSAAPAEERWQEVLRVDDPATTLTLREAKLRAERALGAPIPASDLSVAVDGGSDVAGKLLVRLIEGPGLDATFGELAGGSTQSEGKVIILYCHKCKISS